MKRFAIFTLLAGMLSTSAAGLQADGCSAETETGCGYRDCCAAPRLSPSVAIGLVAVVATIAVLINNRNHNNHSHNSHNSHSSHSS